MSHSSKSVGKQGGTKVRKQPYESFQPATKPQLVPVEEPTAAAPDPQQLQQIMLQALLKMTPQQKADYHKKLEAEMHRVYTNKFGKNYTKESAIRVFNDERRQILDMLQKSNSNMQNKLMEESPVPNKEMHMRKAMQTKEKLLRRMELDNFYPGDMNSADMLEYMPTLNEMTTHLFNAYGTTEQLKEEYATEPTNTVDEFIDDVIQNLPPIAQIIIDDNIDYLEELDRLYPRNITPDYLGSQEKPETILLEQRCENYLICKTFPLLLEQDKEPGKLYPMQTSDIKDLVYVPADEYDRRQILNRIKSKLSGLKPHIQKSANIRVSGFRTDNRDSSAMFRQIKGFLGDVSEKERFAIIATESAFRDFCTKQGIPNYPDKELIRLDLLDSFPALTGTHTTNAVTAIPTSKDEKVNIFNTLRAWSHYDDIKNLFYLTGQKIVPTTVSLKLGIPDKLPNSISVLLSYFSYILIGLSILAVIFALLFAGDTKVPQRSSVPIVSPPIVPQPTPVAAPTPLHDPKNYNGLSSEVLKRLIPDLTALNTTLSENQRAAFSQISNVFNLSAEFNTTYDFATTSIDQMSGQELIEFLKSDVKRRLFYYTLGDYQLREKVGYKEIMDSFQLLGYGYDKSLAIDSIEALWKNYNIELKKKKTASDREIFIQNVEEVVDQLFEKSYTDAEALRSQVRKQEKAIYQAKVLANQDIDNTLSILSLYTDSFGQISNSVKRTLDNMVDIAMLNENIPALMAGNKLSDVEQTLYAQHMKLILENYPEYNNQSMIDMYAPTVLGSSYLKIFDILTNSSSIDQVRANFRYYGKYNSSYVSLRENVNKIIPYTRKFKEVQLFDPARARSVWIEAHLNAVNGIAWQLGKKLNVRESINAILYSLIGTSILSAGALHFLAFFGFRFGEMSRWVKFSQKTWFVYAIYTLSSMSMFYYEYESTFATIISSMSMPLGLALSVAFPAVEIVASLNDQRPGSWIFPLLGGFDPDIEQSKSWWTAFRESMDIFGTVSEPWYTAAATLGGLMVSAVATTATAWALPIIAISGVTVKAAYRMADTYNTYRQEQMQLRMQMVKTILNVLVIDAPPIWQLFSRVFPNEEMDRDKKGNASFSQASNDIEMRNIKWISLITGIVISGYSVYLAPENILRFQKETLYGLLKVNTVSNDAIDYSLGDQIATLNIKLSVLNNAMERSNEEYRRRFAVATNFYEDIHATQVYFSEILAKLSDQRKVFNDTAVNLESLRRNPRALKNVSPREFLWLQEVKVNGTWTYTQETKDGLLLGRNILNSTEIEEKGLRYKFAPEKEYTQIGAEELLETGQKVVCVRPTGSYNWIWVPSYYFPDVNHSVDTLDLQYANVEVTKSVPYQGKFFQEGERFVVQKFTENRQSVWRIVSPDGGFSTEIPLDAVSFSPLETVAPQETGKLFMRMSEGTGIYKAGVVLPTENGSLYQLFKDLSPPAVVYAKREELFEIPQGSFKVKITGEGWEAATIDSKTGVYYIDVQGPSLSFTSPKFNPGQVFTVDKVTKYGFRVGTRLYNGVPVDQILKFRNFDYLEILEDEQPELQPLVSSRCVTKKNRPQRK